MKPTKEYVAIDLKSFYASVECVERGLNPLDVCLVVADEERTDKTICLALSPGVKHMGLGGRPRLFEVKQQVRRFNSTRGRSRRSTSWSEISSDGSVQADFIVARPRMALYMKYSARIYQIYLRYFAPEDIHVYSIDEVMIDVTDYKLAHRMPTEELTRRVINDVLAETGITATAGIGSNLYLAKVAMDIMAKRMKPDKNGVRIASLDEMSYRRQLWDHTPLTDFWRVGSGIATRLARYGIRTMGDIARCSLHHEGILYKMLGVNAELLIDHAWGWEPVTISDIKSYRPVAKSVGTGQVLAEPYASEKARTVVKEMADSLALDLYAKQLVAEQLTLTVGYDAESLRNPAVAEEYCGAIHIDRFGRSVPTHAHGTIHLGLLTDSATLITQRTVELFDRIINPSLLVRRITITAEKVVSAEAVSHSKPQQLSLFIDYKAWAERRKREQQAIDREHRRQNAILQIKRRYGKNAILKGINYADGATQRTRNVQIGGHHE